MIKFLHHLFNPHCPHCREEKYESKLCQSCEVLKEEIARLRVENTRLLDSILNPKSSEPNNREEVDRLLKPIISGAIPWNTRRQMMEANDRDTAEKRRKAEEAEKINIESKPISSDSSIDKLEKELGVTINE